MSDFVYFFTDPHLGLQRSAGTTGKSKKLYEQALFEQVQSIISLALSEYTPLICLGDLFDTTHNSEEVILQGLEVARACKVVLAGNHDISNKVDDRGSLHLVKEILENEYIVGTEVIISPDPSLPFFECKMLDKFDTVFCFVPHCLTQEIFRKSLEEAVSAAIEEIKEGDKCVLCLHCNVGNGMGKLEDGGCPLWLTDELQELVLTKFDKVLIGHEHEPKELHEGRIIILGNTFPVSYGEIAPRFMYKMNLVTTELEKIEIFKVEGNYLELHVDTCLEVSGELAFEHRLVEIVGTMKPTDQAPLARALMKLWSENPQLLAVKKSVEVTDSGLSPAAKKVLEKRNLRQIVSDAILDSGYSEEFRELEEEKE